MRDRQQWRASVRKTKRALLKIAVHACREQRRAQFRLRRQEQINQMLVMENEMLRGSLQIALFLEPASPER